MRLKVILSALAVVLFSFGLADAGQINNVITFSPGVRNILPDQDAVPSDGFLLYGANIAYKRYFVPNISSQLRTGYWFGPFVGKDVKKTGDKLTEFFNIVPVTLSLNYEFLPDHRWNPYIGAGAGADFIYLSWSYKTPKTPGHPGTSDDGIYPTFCFSFYGVAGFDYFMTNNFGMGLDLSYNYAPKADLGGTRNRKLRKVAVLVNFNYAF